MCGVLDDSDRIKRRGVNKRQVFVLSGIVVTAAILIAGIAYLRYRNFHAIPFERNGTKQAVLFLEREINQAHLMEYVAVTQVTADGEIRRPIFRDAFFTGRIKVSWFDEQDMIKFDEAKQAEGLSIQNGVTEIWLCLRRRGIGSHEIPSVDLRYFFEQNKENEIVRLSWNDWRDGKEKIYWAVTGIADVEQAREALANFFGVVQAGEFGFNSWLMEEVSNPSAICGMRRGEAIETRETHTRIRKAVACRGGARAGKEASSLTD